MSDLRPLIVLDNSRHDHLHIGYGLYRYGVDLVSGLARIRPNVDFILLGSNPEPVAELRNVFCEPGSRWSYIPISRRERGRGAYFLDQVSVLKQLWNVPLSLYHSTDYFAPLLLCEPIVITIFDIMMEIIPGRKPYREPLYLTCLKRLIRHRIRRVVTISHTTAKDLHARWRVPRNKLSVTYLAARFLDDQRIEESCEGGEINNSNELVVLSRYALNPWKNLPALLEAVALLRKEFPALKLLLFGKVDVGPEHETQFNELLRKLGIQDVVERLGVVSEDELRVLYKRATVFALPSLYEGFGLPLIEAMASGTCVVAHHASAMAEVVGTGGCLADARRPEALAAAIAPLLRDESQRTQLAEAGRMRASRFTIETMAEATYNVYRSCLYR